MKTSELTGATLDYWVAKAEGDEPVIHSDEKGPWCQRRKVFPHGGHSDAWFHPSSSWLDAGPIIEREGIDTATVWDGGKRQWRAIADFTVGVFEGPTPLIAAMRAYVASKFGDEVPDGAAGEGGQHG